MASNYLAKGLKRSALTVALGLCFAGGVHAQSTSGSIFGKAEPGQTVTIVGDTGLTRTITTDATGKYNAVALPAGHYKVTSGSDTRDVTVLVSTGAQVDFGGAVNLSAVTVVGDTVPDVDVSQTDVRTVFTAEELNKIAVGRTINDVALLAPGVISSTSYGGVASFGGSDASENAYYINGFPVTNPLTSIGYYTLGFDSIAQTQLLTGGYGAEFGRSTGGVVSIITKHGTNEWKGGVYAIYSPSSLRASPRSIFYDDTGMWSQSSHYNTATGNNPLNWTDGTLYAYRAQNQSDSLTYGLYASGPIIKDRLFFYANAEMGKVDSEAVRYTRVGNLTPSNAAQGWSESTSKYPRWTAKIDWNITDNHILEVTAIQDETKSEYAYYGYDYNTFKHDNVQYTSAEGYDDKARLYIGKYTGYLTDNLTISAMYGKQKVDHIPYAQPGYDPNAVFVSIAPSVVPAAFAGAKNAALYSSVTEPGTDETKAYRFDVTYALGDHELRAGIDNNSVNSYRKSGISGPGYRWSYGTVTPGNAINGSANGEGTPTNGYGAQGFYVAQIFSFSGGPVSTDQKAYYVEDRWHVTDDFLLSLGLRNDSFTNYNGDGIAFIDQEDEWAPRIGFSWDVNGDSSLKVFGNAGRYFLALPNNVAFRQANGSMNASKYYTYTGIDMATGVPTGLQEVPLVNNDYACSNGAVSANLECGQAPDPHTVTSIDLKPHYQDEYILGMDQQVNESFSWGAKFTYRILQSAIDDECIYGCFIFNPGEDASFYVDDGNGGYNVVDISKAQFGLPDMKRNYNALDLYAQYRKGRFFGKLNYTLAHSYGNTEGRLNSTIDGYAAGGQSDVSVTEDWDLVELMEHGNGYLPNDRRHQLKFNGYFQFTDEWRVGGSVLIQSGRPRSCMSYYPDPVPGLYGGAVYHFCGIAGSASSPTSPYYTGSAAAYVPPSADFGPSPRGTYGTTPWTTTFNVNVTYNPSWAKGLTLSADVMNLFNSQTVGAYVDQYANSRTTMNPSFNRPLYFSSPRSLRFTARYDF